MRKVQLAATQRSLVLRTVSFVQQVNTLLPWAAQHHAITAQLAATPLVWLLPSVSTALLVPTLQPQLPQVLLAPVSCVLLALIQLPLLPLQLIPA